MFLTEFDVNTGRRAARHLLGSRERIHAAVLGCFPPGQSSDESTRTLWRLDHVSSHAVKLLIVSPLRPDLTALNEQAGWTTGSSGRTADYGPFLHQLEVGQMWRFRLTANPVSARRGEDAPKGTRGKRVAHVTAQQQADWLASRAERLGVTFPEDEVGVPRFAVTGREIAQFRRGSSGEGRRVTLAVTQYDGVVAVADPEKLRSALMLGIGAGKGYGCGLMTLAPLRR